jgi:hypothetical protein
MNFSGDNNLPLDCIFNDVAVASVVLLLLP